MISPHPLNTAVSRRGSNIPGSCPALTQLLSGWKLNPHCSQREGRTGEAAVAWGQLEVTRPHCSSSLTSLSRGKGIGKGPSTLQAGPSSSMGQMLLMPALGWQVCIWKFTDLHVTILVLNNNHWKIRCLFQLFGYCIIFTVSIWTERKGRIFLAYFCWSHLCYK